MAGKKKIQAYCMMTVLFFVASLVFMAKPCVGQTRVRTYKKGFTSQKIDGNIARRIQGKSYKKGAEISMGCLRYLKMMYVDFEGNLHQGEMIVNKKIARRTLKIFYRLYRMKYPIAKMQLVDEYDADDEKSMADNNTSAFNYRKVANTNRLSNHSMGLAIDINPRINPCVNANGIAPANSRVYRVRNVSKCRGKYRKYMICRNDKVYKLFKRYGFSWGGDWKHSKDYQHFEMSD